MEREVVVSGEGEIRVAPDHAAIRVVVDGEGSSREDAYDGASRAARSVDEVLEVHEAALVGVTSTALVVQPRTRWRKGETVRTGWKASRTSLVKIGDLERTGEILARLTGAGAALSGLSWELDERHDAHDTARQQAARDARRRATTYAEALGLQLGPVAWITEPGLRNRDSTWVQAGGYPTAARAAMSEEPIEIQPEEIVVRARVDVGFRIEDG
jgi:uncharacterized protein YggE